MNHHSLHTGAVVTKPAIRLGLLAAALACGCSKSNPSPSPSPVEGTVLFLGRPLANGLVVFTPDRGRGASGRATAAAISADGRYALPHLAAGWYHVSLSDRPSWQAVDGFPAELRRPDRSGLSREILPGRDHRIDFHIEAVASH